MLRIHTRARTLDEFLDRYSQLVDGNKIVLFTSSLERVGARLEFTIQLAGGAIALRGRGSVRRVRRAEPRAMELDFVPLDVESANVVEFLRSMRAGVSGEDTPVEVPFFLPALAPEEETVPANPFAGISDGVLAQLVDAFPPKR
jgi:hypothetical protein